MINLLPELKKDGKHEWLVGVSASSLQTVCLNLEKAYKNFFKHGFRFPKYKSRKRSSQSYPVCSSRLQFCGDGTVKIQKLGNVKYKTDF